MREELSEMKEARKLLSYTDDFEESTGNVHVTVEAAKKSEPPAAKIAVSFIQAVRGWPQALVGIGLLLLAAWYMWLHH